MTAEQKLISLKNNLKKLNGAVVAFSGGIDSTFLASVAHQVLGSNLLAVTVVWEVMPQKEQQQAIELAQRLGLRHQIMPMAGLANPKITANTKDRCYYCKHDMLTGLWQLARQNNLSQVLVGDNQDDLNDYRPGSRAVKQCGAQTPLQAAGLTKAEIRQLARSMQLPNWAKPAQACLASRIPYGETITAAKLAMVEQAEQILHSLGIKQVRVRHHGNLARLEVTPTNFPQITANTETIISRLKQIGYQYITLDLQGYRTGSLNETLNNREQKTRGRLPSFPPS